MVRETLKRLHFTEKEIDVYLAVLTYGKVAPAEVSRLTRISRPTVYSVAKTLVQKGVISEDLGGKISYLVAQPLEDLGTLVAREKEALRQKEEFVQEAIAELSPLVGQVRYSIPKIRFVEEAELRNYLYNHVTTWHGSAKKFDGAWWGFQDHTFVEQYTEWIDYIWKEIHPDGHVKLLSNKSDTEKGLRGKYAGREIKYWHKSLNFTGTIWVVGEYLIMIITQQHPYYLIEIRDAVLAHNMRELFKNIWTTLD